MVVYERENGGPVQFSATVRTVLIESHVAAVAILLLMSWSIADLLYALEPGIQHVLVFIGTAIAIVDIPTPPSPFEIRMAVLRSSDYLIAALAQFGMAWVVSKALYKAAPISALRRVVSNKRRPHNA